MRADPQLAPADRVAAADRDAVTGPPDELGCAPVPALLAPEECRSPSALHPQVERFRSFADVRRVRFGSGQYRYFAHPVPDLVARLREAFSPLEQWPRARSRSAANVIRQRDALVLTTSERRPVLSSRGWSTGPITHGVSVVRSEVRHALGLVFHDAQP